RSTAISGPATPPSGSTRCWARPSRWSRTTRTRASSPSWSTRRSTPAWARSGSARPPRAWWSPATTWAGIARSSAPTACSIPPCGPSRAWTRWCPPPGTCSSPPRGAADMGPRRFGRYEVQQEIGDGAMGRVFRCLDPLMKRVVAIKTVKKEYLTRDTRDEYLRRFRREAQAAGRLSHPNIVNVFDVGEDFFVMEYLEGSSLQTILRDRGQLPIEETLRILPPLADALDYAHRSAIVHRHLKPGNVMVLADGRPKLMDFGVAHLESSSMTAQGQSPGDRFANAPSLVRALERREPGASAAELGLAEAGGGGIGGGLRTLSTTAPGPSPVPPALLGALETQDLASATSIDLPWTPARAGRRRLRWATVAALVIAGGVLGLYLGGRRADTVVSPAPPPAGPAVLRIETEPAGATVLIDGADAGRSPVAMANVRPGVHMVRVAADGYAPAGLTLEIKHGETPPPLRFVMEPLAAKLRVHSEPPDALVRVDGQPVGTTPLESSSLAPGHHEIRLERRGYAAASQKVE